jgi:hypothetical protein
MARAGLSLRPRPGRGTGRVRKLGGASRRDRGGDRLAAGGPGPVPRFPLSARCGHRHPAGRHTMPHGQGRPPRRAGCRRRGPASLGPACPGFDRGGRAARRGRFPLARQRPGGGRPGLPDQRPGNRSATRPAGGANQARGRSLAPLPRTQRRLSSHVDDQSPRSGSGPGLLAAPPGPLSPSLAGARHDAGRGRRRGVRDHGQQRARGGAAPGDRAGGQPDHPAAPRDRRLRGANLPRPGDLREGRGRPHLRSAAEPSWRRRM